MGMIARLDEAFGRIIDALISRGELDNTIVLFTSDHGCHFKTRNAEYKRSCHEASIRVPPLLAGPGLNGRGEITRAAALIDLPPTLLNAAGTRRAGVARQRCWRYDWVLDLDIKAFFDSIEPDLLMRAVRKHTDCAWVLLYIERWLVE